MNKHLYNILKVVIICCITLIQAGILLAQDSSDEFYTLARAAGERGKYTQALEYCERGLKKSPLDMDLQEYLGKCYMELGQLDKSRIILLDVLKKSPKRVDARHYLINIETQTKRYYSAVCYVNELLEITPYSKTLWLKKINLYNLMDNKIEANRSAKRLYQIFPNDNDVKSIYNQYLREDALKLTRERDLFRASNQYEKIIELESNDPDIYLNLINTYLKLGNYVEALTIADIGLQKLPNSNALFDKKIGILEEQNEYQKAIDLLQAKLRKGESPQYRRALNYLTTRAAEYYKNTDPYVLYGKVYAQNPGNQDAYNFLVNTAITRGYTQDAEELLKKGLKSNPNSKILLTKLLTVYEIQKDWEKIGNIVNKLYTLYPNDTDIKESYYAWSYQKAKLDFNEQNYKEALWGFLKVSQSPEYKRYANQYIFNIHAQRGNYDDALNTINGMIKAYPQESQYVLNKVDLLMTMGESEEAYNLAKSYQKEYPNSPEYAQMAKDAAVGFIKYLNNNQDFARVKAVADELIASDPNNIQAYNYAVGARVAMKNYDEALDLLQKTIVLYPSSKDLKLKLAGIYAETDKHEQAAELLKDLRVKYPYNDTLKNSLVEELMLYAKSTDEKKEFDKSKQLYGEVISLEKKSQDAAIKLSNIYLDENKTDSAMLVVDNSLNNNPDYPDLLFQKSVVYEKMGDYKQAKEYQARFVAPLNKPKQHLERLDELEGKSLDNQVNISYLRAQTDSAMFNTSVASLEYLKATKNKMNTYVARINYAARNNGVGVQGEVDWYHSFKNKSNFLANVGVSNQFFPRFKGAFSFYQPFAKVWQAEIGARYARLPNNNNFITGIVGLERQFNNVWLNGKLHVMSDGNKMYNNILAQSRFYMKNEKNYIMTMASVGNAPEDPRLDFQVNTFLSYVNTMVGAGYFHYINNKTSIGAIGNWYNYKVSPNSYLNQYNIYLTVRTKF